MELVDHVIGGGGELSRDQLSTLFEISDRQADWMGDHNEGMGGDPAPGRLRKAYAQASAKHLRIARDRATKASTWDGQPSYSQPRVPSAFDGSAVRVFRAMSAAVSSFREKVALLRSED